MAIFPKFNTIPIKILPACSVEVDKLILKFIQNFKRPRIVKTILEKNKDGRHTFYLKTYYKATVVKIM